MVILIHLIQSHKLNMQYWIINIQSRVNVMVTIDLNFEIMRQYYGTLRKNINRQK